MLGLPASRHGRRSLDAATLAERRMRRRASDPSLRRLVSQLLAARIRAGLTQEQVAWRLGTKKSAISRLESGTASRPTLTTIENYALVVGCRVEILLRPLPSDALDGMNLAGASTPVTEKGDN